MNNFETFIAQVQSAFARPYIVSSGSSDFQRFLFAAIQHPISDAVVKIYFQRGNHRIHNPLNSDVVHIVRQHFALGYQHDLEINAQNSGR